MIKKNIDIWYVSNLLIIHHIWLRSRNLDFWRIYRTSQWSSKYIFWILIYMQLLTKISCRMKSSIWWRHLVNVIDNLFWKLQFSTICFVSERRNVLERQILNILKVSFSLIVNTFLYFCSTPIIFLSLLLP